MTLVSQHIFNTLVLKTDFLTPSYFQDGFLPKRFSDNFFKQAF